MTVSLALRNHASISMETRRHVQTVADQLGYRTDPAVGELLGKLRWAAHRRPTSSIGIIANRVGHRTWRDIPTHVAYYEGARDRAALLGYNIKEYCLDAKKATAQKIKAALQAAGIHGAVVLPTVNQAGAFDLELDCAELSLATIGYSLQSPKIHRSCIHHMNVASEACRQLRKCGYQRPGLAIDLHQDRRSGYNWSAGFLVSESLAGADSPVPIYRPTALTFGGFKTWLLRNRPDVVIHVGPPLVDWIERIGFKIPSDIGYVSLDLHHWMGAISGMDQHSRMLGAAAVDLVIAGLRREEYGIPKEPQTAMIEATWRAGGSTLRKIRQAKPGNTCSSRSMKRSGAV